jgi:signal transduction histidine kinase
VRKQREIGLKKVAQEDSPAKTHADLRSESGFDVAELAAEFRALRASIIKLWVNSWEEIDPVDIFDLIRFNESIDQVGIESIRRYKEKIDSFRDTFVDILGQDLRNPLGSISRSSQLLLDKGSLTTDQVILASRIETSAERMKTIITDLIELTNINLGKGISITTDIVDMGSVGRQITAEFQAAHPNRVISFEATGELDGIWDRAHISQVFANLIENAILQGFKDSPITKGIRLPP